MSTLPASVFDLVDALPGEAGDPADLGGHAAFGEEFSDELVSGGLGVGEGGLLLGDVLPVEVEGFGVVVGDGHDVKRTSCLTHKGKARYTVCMEIKQGVWKVWLETNYAMYGHREWQGLADDWDDALPALEREYPKFTAISAHQIEEAS